MAGASRIWKFVKNKLLRVEEEKNIYDVDLPEVTITKKITASFELRVVDRRVFHHLSR